jgi:cyclopropane-fatty-acyl-phospholipid synthase
MNSYLYLGRVEHTRLTPVRHHLDYRLYVYAIDLADLETLDRRLPLFGYNRMRPVAIRDRDYLDRAPGAVGDKLRRLVEREAPGTPVERVVLVTSPRYFHYVFNPVSFYYCYDGEDRLSAAVAEVNNTFGERHLYVLPNLPANGYPVRLEADKRFHVSPFNRVEGRYRFHFDDIRHRLDIRIQLLRDGEPAFEARLHGRPVALNAVSQFTTILSHPVVPHLTVPRIYWQAARLKFQRGLAYNDKPVPQSRQTIRHAPPTPIQRRCRKLVFGTLERATEDGLEVLLPDGARRRFGAPGHSFPARLRIRDHRAFSRMVLGGDIGFGEAFMHGDWDSDDVTAVVRFFIRNRRTLDDGRLPSTVLARAVESLAHFARRNTLVGSRRNIRRHYDLSNDFFETFLDPTMTYSCGIFERPEDSLETAQRAKMRRLMELARIGPGDHVLEIGCGWGGFAVEAVRRTGCRVTGITVSRAQYRYARERVRAAGLADRIDVRLVDYRRMTGRFDKIVSVEMLEAVGHRYFGAFFACCDRLLAPDGLVALQVITIPDAHYEQYRREADWIQKHIFPGGLVPSLSVLARAMADRSRLTMERVENIGIHYARTLRRWRRRFEANRRRVAELGFDETFQRKWIYYLSSCEAGFAERVLGDLHILLTRPGNTILPSDVPGRTAAP